MYDVVYACCTMYMVVNINEKVSWYLKENGIVCIGNQELKKKLQVKYNEEILAFELVRNSKK